MHARDSRRICALDCSVRFVWRCAAATASASPTTDKVLENVRLPTGFKLEVYADQVPGARSMALGQRGTLFVGTRARGGKVYAVSGTPGSAAKPTVRIVADNLNTPNGVAFRDGALYVAEINRLLRYDDIEATLDNIPKPKVVRDDLPKDGHHGWRYIAFGPDGKLYVPIGAPCNVCNEPKYAVITRMNADGSGQEVFARGIRNTVGFTWHPATKQLWFTDNGRDWLGDDAAAVRAECRAARRTRLRLSVLPRQGHQGSGVRPARRVQQDHAAGAALGAHVAPLGVKFYTGTRFPEDYRDRCVHRRARLVEPQGEERLSHHAREARRQRSAVKYEPFATGFNRGDEVFGRPVDLLVLEDGSMLLSDDTAGAIYRISYALPD